MLKNFTRRLCFFAVIVGALTGVAHGQDKNIPPDLYKASTIPDSLKKDANAVIRYSMDACVVKGVSRYVNDMHTVVTILNEKADRDAEAVLFYNKKYSSINSFEMIVYDANGKQIKKYHKTDLYERSAVDNESIITDERLMAIRHVASGYPITIEIIYELEENSSIDYGSYDIQKPEEAVENSYCRFSVPKGIGFKYLNKNTTIKPQIDSLNGVANYLWQVKNLKANKPEDGAVEWKVAPVVYFGNTTFQCYDSKGDISTWDSFGKWVQTLNSNVCTLSPERTEEIKKMTADIKTDKEKAKFLYEYMQKNVRYVSVQLGIGGFKPFAADFVDQKKYGDCKALSNYMYALLKAVNIPAYYAWIRAGVNEEPADPSFPCDSFNHAILCIPFKNDTTWLECTSNTQPFGKLGTFTENRNALLITPEGGRLVNTPKSTLQDNLFKSEVHIALDADGGAKAQVKILSTGEYRNMYLGMTEQKMDDQKEFLIRNLNMRQPSFLEVKNGDDKDGTKEIDLDMEYDKFCDIAAGDKQFYRPRVFDVWRLTVPPLEKRQTDYYFEHPMGKTCVTTIDLPQGFEVESLPANASLKFTYGNFDLKYTYDAAKNQIISTTTFNLTNYIIPAANYNEMQQYMDNIARVQNKKLVIRKKA